MPIVKREPQPDGSTLEIFDDGRINRRLPDGKLITEHMPAEAASRMSKQAAARRELKQSDAVYEILEELGLEASSLAQHLAQQFIGGGVQSVPAARELIKMSPRLLGGPRDMKPPERGERCQLCNRIYWFSGEEYKRWDERTVMRLVKMAGERLQAIEGEG